jgi:large repetitive protein
MFHFLTGAKTPTQARRKFRPSFDVLEARTVPATASMVADIFTGLPGSAPADLVNMGGKLFFSADDGIHGRELWTSDGLPGATHTFMVKDINPGPTGSNPLYLTVVGNQLFFSADDGLHGPELWVSNGTPLGTQIVRDINLGPTGSNPTELIAFQAAPGFPDVLYFAADDGVHGRELWRSDGNGSASETFLVRDINPGPDASNPTDLTTANVIRTVINSAGRRVRKVTPRLFFSADDGLHGAELWSTDGVITRLARDIRPGPQGSNPFNLTGVITNPALRGGFLFFGANDGFLGNELWISNGLGVNQRVRDINPGPASSLSPSPTTLMTQFRGQLFFTATDGFLGRELWQSNGSFAGTRLVKDINPGQASSNPTSQQEPLPQFRSLIVNGLLYFGANDGFFGGELWKTDGSTSGTVRVRDINVGPPSGLVNNLLVGAVFNSTINNTIATIVFAADDGAFGREPWQSDGSTLGTARVQDINTGAPASAPSFFTKVGGILFFAADNGLLGRELWRIG